MSGDKINSISLFTDVSMLSFTYQQRGYLIDITVAKISQSFTQKMASKTSWHRHGTKLRDCRPMYNAQVGYMHACLLLFNKATVDI